MHTRRKPTRAEHAKALTGLVIAIVVLCLLAQAATTATAPLPF